MSLSFQKKVESLAVMFLFALSLYLLAASISPIYANKAEDIHVCPAGDIKWDGGYEYNDGSGGVSVFGNTANWGPTAGYEIIRVCIKAGQDLYYPDSNSGAYTTENKKDISHVVLYTKEIEEPQNGEQPEVPKEPRKEAEQEKGEVLGKAVLPETGVNILGLMLAILAFQTGLLLRRKAKTSL